MDERLKSVCCLEGHGILTPIPGSPTFPFPFNLGHKYKPRAYIRSAVVSPLILSFSKKVLPEEV